MASKYTMRSKEEKLARDQMIKKGERDLIMLSLFLCLQHRRFWLKRLDFFRCLELLYNHQTNAPRTIFVRGVFL